MQIERGDLDEARREAPSLRFSQRLSGAITRLWGYSEREFVRLSTEDDDSFDSGGTLKRPAGNPDLAAPPRLPKSKQLSILHFTGRVVKLYRQSF